MTTLSFPMRKNTPVLAQLLTALVAGALLYVGLVLAWVIGYQLLYAGRIFPGISVAGVDLSGLPPDTAAAKLSQTLSYPISGKVLLRDGDKVWSASPAQLGMVFDASTSAHAAYRMGRSGGLFRRWADRCEVEVSVSTFRRWSFSISAWPFSTFKGWRPRSISR